MVFSPNVSLAWQVAGVPNVSKLVAYRELAIHLYAKPDKVNADLIVGMLLEDFCDLLDENTELKERLNAQ